MIFEELLAQRRVVAEPTDRDEIESLRALVRRYLSDAAIEELSPDGRFERSYGAARTLAIGGVTLSGFLAVAGCFLLGCCGSPMLAVYLSLFGASFLPFARPLVAGVTTITIIVGWFWMNRWSPVPALDEAALNTEPGCHCD